MGARFRRNTLEDMAHDMRGVAVGAVPELHDRMEELGQRTESDIQRRITESYTRTGEARVASGRGSHAGRRVEDVMYNAVEHRTTSPVPAVVNSEVGWINTFLEYFGFQEKGTRYIPAMHALRDAGDEARDELKELGRDYIKDAARKIGG